MGSQKTQFLKESMGLNIGILRGMGWEGHTKKDLLGMVSIFNGKTVYRNLSLEQIGIIL